LSASAVDIDDCGVERRFGTDLFIPGAGFSKATLSWVMSVGCGRSSPGDGDELRNGSTCMSNRAFEIGRTNDW
jgi:hypothetical protein